MQLQWQSSRSCRNYLFIIGKYIIWIAVPLTCALAMKSGERDVCWRKKLNEESRGVRSSDLKEIKLPGLLMRVLRDGVTGSRSYTVG